MTMDVDKEQEPVIPGEQGSELSLRDEVAWEHGRIRRLVGWFLSLFVLISLVSVAFVLLAGITVLHQSQQLVDSVSMLQDYVSVNTVHISSMTNRFADIERRQRNLIARMNAIQTTAEQDSEQLGAMLHRHERWINSRAITDERDKRHLHERLQEMGEDWARHGMLLDRLERRLDDVLLVDGAVIMRVPDKKDVAPSPDVQATVVKDVFEAADIKSLFENLVEQSQVPEPDTSRSRHVQVVTFPNGDRYEGEFRHGLMHGWGVYTSRSGDRFEGTFENDRRHGPGTLKKASGERFSGWFVNGIRQGLGSLTFADGKRYAGDFRNDMINGRGVMLYPDGGQFAGSFTHGRRHGDGVMRFPNGDVYEGEFRNDLRTGKGTYWFADGSRYEGDFVDGVRHGHGRFVFTDGAEYIGPFSNGHMHGEGVRVYADGQRVRGVWYNGEHVRDLYER